MPSDPGQASSRAARIAVCIPTFRRNPMLRDCLDAVNGLRVPGSSRLEIIVADNDASGGARTLCDGMRDALRFPLHYCVEPERGLASVRNRLLEEALRVGADWIAFIDDDERPDPGWLEAHLRALGEFGAAVSSGPVVAVAPGRPAPPPPARRPTGSTPRNVACNNVVFSAALAGAQRARFDPDFNFIGGEDFEFFERSGRIGNRHVWCAEAVVFETIPPERATWRYLFMRHYSGATNAVVRHRKAHAGASTWTHFLLKAAGKLLGACVSALCAGVSLRRSLAEAAVKQFANALGYVSGLFRRTVERYR